MPDEMFKQEDLKPGDRLAIMRTLMAADRTLLATVRTSLSLIAFGFTIFKVLGNVNKIEGVRIVREHTPRNIGIFLLLVGIVPLLLAMYQYKGTVKRLGGKGVYLNPNMVTAGAILLLGLGLLAVVLTNINLI